MPETPTMKQLTRLAEAKLGKGWRCCSVVYPRGIRVYYVGTDTGQQLIDITVRTGGSATAKKWIKRLLETVHEK